MLLLADLINIDTSGIATLEDLQRNLISEGIEVNELGSYFHYFPLLLTQFYFILLCLIPVSFLSLSQLAIANPRWQVIHKLKLSNFVGKIGGRVFVTVAEAVDGTITGKIAT